MRGTCHDHPAMATARPARYKRAMQTASFPRLVLSVIAIVSGGALVTAFIAQTRGTDLSALDGRIDEVRMKVEGDPDFSAAAKALLAHAPVPSVAPVAPAALAAPSSSRIGTPCLDRLK